MASRVQFSWPAAHKMFDVGLGVPNRGPGAPGLPTGGIRPPLPQPLHPQTDGATRQAQPRSYMPGMDNHVAPQGSKDDISGVNSTAQEVANAPKKVLDPSLKSELLC
jgi:hypothetical protein